MIYITETEDDLMKTLMVEIHAAEGGADSQLLTQDLARAYERFFARKG